MAESLRSQLERPGLITVPGVFDAMGALVARQAGFSAVSVTGNGLSAYLMGRPDMGLVTMSEVVAQTRYIAAAAGVPVIADADTGYGGPLNVYRAVLELAKAGAAAIHIEDQPNPKKCAYLGGPPLVVEIPEAVQRLRAARAAADAGGILLIARTDAHRGHGIDEVVRRAEAYAAAGADMIFSATVGSLEEVRRLAEAVALPIMVNMNTSAAIAGATATELEQAGARVALYPSILRNAVLKSMQQVLAQFRQDGHLGNVRPLLATNEAYEEILGTAEWVRLERELSEPGER